MTALSAAPRAATPMPSNTASIHLPLPIRKRRGLGRGCLGEFNDEEALLTTLIGRTAESIRDCKLTHDEYVVALRAVSLAIGRIESLHRSRKVIYDNQTTLDKALDELKIIPVEED